MRNQVSDLVAVLDAEQTTRVEAPTMSPMSRQRRDRIGEGSKSRRPRHETACGKRRTFPPELEAIRKEWLAALAADDDDRAAELRRQLDASLKEHGFFKRNALSAWDPDRATEVQPGVFVQDERPSSTGAS